jgi:predicted transposase YbfD/YdcC
MTLIEQLKSIKDPRKPRGQRYALWLVMFLALLGSLCGYYGYRPLAKFVQKHHFEICQLLEFAPDKKLLPSPSTFRRIFQQVDAQAWVDSFNGWVVTHAPDLSGQLLSIDGKSIRCTSSGGNTSAQNFACLVSVDGQSVGVVQMALMDNAKVSEIGVAKRLLTAVYQAPTLAQSLDIGFSLDALHAQVKTLELMHTQQQQYIVGLKTNQKTLYQQMQHLFASAIPLSEATQALERRHGRQVQRTAWVYAAPSPLPQRWASSGITRIIWVKRTGMRSGKPFEEMHCYLSNGELNAFEFLHRIRTHWQIENGLH